MLWKNWNFQYPEFFFVWNFDDAVTEEDVERLSELGYFSAWKKFYQNFCKWKVFRHFEKDNKFCFFCIDFFQIHLKVLKHFLV